MRKKIRLKNHYYSGTRLDHIVGGHPPKSRPPRPDSWVFIVRPREEPPEDDRASR
jgi:hypothetical protein